MTESCCRVISGLHAYHPLGRGGGFHMQPTSGLVGPMFWRNAGKQIGGPLGIIQRMGWCWTKLGVLNIPSNPKSYVLIKFHLYQDHSQYLTRFQELRLLCWFTICLICYHIVFSVSIAVHALGHDLVGPRYSWQSVQTLVYPGCPKTFSDQVHGYLAKNLECDSLSLSHFLAE